MTVPGLDDISSVQKGPHTFARSSHSIFWSIHLHSSIKFWNCITLRFRQRSTPSLNLWVDEEFVGVAIISEIFHRFHQRH
jgi:hypothetical protein